MKSTTYAIGSWRAGANGMACWIASAKWAAGPALDGQRDMPLALRLSEGLGITGAVTAMRLFVIAPITIEGSLRVGLLICLASILLNMQKVFCREDWSAAPCILWE